MYIDPNTGGMLFQVLAAFLAVFSGALLLFSSKIRAGIARLRRSLRGDKAEQPVESKPEDDSGDE
jgi:hypothetical protein